MKEVEVSKFTLEYNIRQHGIHISIEVNDHLYIRRNEPYDRDFWANSNSFLIDLKNRGYAYLEGFKWQGSRTKEDLNGTILYVDGNAKWVKFVDSKEELAKELI